MPLLFFLALLIFGTGTARIATPFFASPEPVETVTVNPCYLLEEGVKITLDASLLPDPTCQALLGNKTFVRIRQEVRILDGKTDEARGAAWTCEESDSLRKIATLPDGRLVYWLPENHLGNDTSQFIFIFLKKKGGYHHFDIYIDEALKNDLPDFVINCQETGGLVPVVEGPSTPTFPPQTISLTDQEFNSLGKQSFDVDGFEDNFASYSAELAPYYLRIDPPAGQDVEIPDGAVQMGFFYKTISGETRTYDVLFHGGIVYLRDQSSGKPYMYNPSDTRPPFAVERDSTLQLAALRFVTVSEWTWGTPSCKPAIYLYPEKPTKLRVWLNPAGQLTVTNPPYDPKTGWEVLVHPDGTLSVVAQLAESHKFDQGRPLQVYPYLYYEAEIEKVKTPKKGWVVKKEELENLFDELLPFLGLNQNETQEFKTYWLSVLSSSPYYFVGVVDREELERIEPIKFSQKPDTFIRVRLFFEPLEQPVFVEPPKLPSTPARYGFVAVDWGGILSSGTCQGGETLNLTSR